MREKLTAISLMIAIALGSSGMSFGIAATNTANSSAQNHPADQVTNVYNYYNYTYVNQTLVNQTIVTNNQTYITNNQTYVTNNQTYVNNTTVQNVSTIYTQHFINATATITATYNSGNYSSWTPICTIPLVNRTRVIMTVVRCTDLVTSGQDAEIHGMLFGIDMVTYSRVGVGGSIDPTVIKNEANSATGYYKTGFPNATSYVLVFSGYKVLASDVPVSVSIWWETW